LVYPNDYKKSISQDPRIYSYIFQYDRSFSDLNNRILKNWPHLFGLDWHSHSKLYETFLDIMKSDEPFPIEKLNNEAIT